ncbi:MAG: hypothetical protein K1W30_20985 [Lachnospiraceae bacterium]
MSTLQNQITQSLEGLSDDSLRFMIESMKGQKFIADGHDIDECNSQNY